MPLKTGKRLTVNLDDDVAAGAEERAKNMRCSMSDYVNRLILADLMERAGILLTEHGAYFVRLTDKETVDATPGQKVSEPKPGEGPKPQTGTGSPSRPYSPRRRRDAS